MSPDLTLEPIARGDTAADAAQIIIREYLQNASAPRLRELYNALRRWTWKALISRRTDPELSKWFEIIKSVEIYCATRNEPATCVRFAVLSDLVDDSIRFAEANPHEALLKRRHVRPLLEAIRLRNDWVDRRALLQELGLGEATLSTLLTALIAAGKVDREMEGREARFRLTLGGYALTDAFVEAGRKSGPTPLDAHMQQIALERLMRAREEIEASIESLQGPRAKVVKGKAVASKAPATKAAAKAAAAKPTALAAGLKAASAPAKPPPTSAQPTVKTKTPTKITGASYTRARQRTRKASTSKELTA